MTTTTQTTTYLVVRGTDQAVYGTYRDQEAAQKALAWLDRCFPDAGSRIAVHSPHIGGELPKVTAGTAPAGAGRCDETCLTAKREGGRRGGQQTVARHGREHMSKIGKSGFHMLALRLGDGHANYAAALYVLAGRGAMQPFTGTPAQPWRGKRPSSDELVNPWTGEAEDVSRSRFAA